MPSMQPCFDCGASIRKPAMRCRSCNDQHQRGENNSHWKGGISLDRSEYRHLQWERYPEKYRARLMVFRALKAGKLMRQPCQWQGCTIGPDRTEAHHWSYEPGRELDVTFFCLCHHRQVAKLNQEQFEFIQAVNRKRATVLKLDATER